MNGKTAPGAFGVGSVLLVLTVLFLLPGRVLASEYRVIALSGEVTVKHGEEKARAVSQGDLFGPGYTVRTRRDSTLRLEDGRTGYMVYPYSLVNREKNPGSSGGNFQARPTAGSWTSAFFFIRDLHREEL